MQKLLNFFSNALDIALDDTSMCSDINDLSDKITSSILNSSDKYIPPLERSKENKPWTDEHFLCLIENRNKAKKVEEKRTLDKEVKKYRDKLKNDYFSKKADMH